MSSWLFFYVFVTCLCTLLLILLLLLSIFETVLYYFLFCHYTTFYYVTILLLYVRFLKGALEWFYGAGYIRFLEGLLDGLSCRCDPIPFIYIHTSLVGYRRVYLLSLCSCRHALVGLRICLLFIQVLQIQTYTLCISKHTRTQRHTHTHTERHTERHRDTDRHTHTQTHRHTHTHPPMFCSHGTCLSWLLTGRA